MHKSHLKSKKIYIYVWKVNIPLRDKNVQSDEIIKHSSIVTNTDFEVTTIFNVLYIMIVVKTCGKPSEVLGCPENWQQVQDTTNIILNTS